MAAEQAVEQTFRQEHGRVMAWLVGAVGGDFQLAEDSLQEAMIVALQTWPSRGVPKKPGAWLATTAKRKAIDVLRRRQNYQKKQRQLRDITPDAVTDELWEEEYLLQDDRLKLIFTCCHPALSAEARVALTLRTVAGLKTPEIAAAFLVPTTTMAQRLVRCKKKIKQAGIPYRVPPDHLLAERLASVLSVLYLIFNEGYEATFGAQLLREDLCGEAIRLARILDGLMPSEPEILGLLALMLCQHSRSAARVDKQGLLVTLENQDRSLWDSTLYDEGERLLDRAMTRRSPGPYQVQAAIASLHCQAAIASDTDWPQIAALYNRLYCMTPTPVVALNRIVAVAMADGPQLGLKMLEDLELQCDLSEYRWFHATRADLYRRAGEGDRAVEAYQRTLALTNNETERAYLQQRIAEIKLC